jgi:protein SCO1/2/putative membrane protein
MSRFTFLFLATALVFPSLSGCAAKPETFGEVADFQLTNQDGGLISRADLLGKVWVASFIFTRCSTGCPQVISGTLTELQKDLKDKNGVLLVSFTVDPEYDNPDLLKAYAESHGADPGYWWWLTGERDSLYQLIRGSFHLAVAENQGTARTPGNEVAHSTRLVLVDRGGQIRGYFEGRQTDDRGETISELPQLRRAIEHVRVEERSRGIDFPALNASLNALGTALLITGYAAIRRGRVRLHMTCMLSALTISAMFLISYLYYHVIVRQGEPTRFTGTGAARTVYFLILSSHTILAALVPPLAVFTAYQALRGRFDRHVPIARLTLPIWLYVSVTGVLVYWMLYRLFPPQ